MKQSGGKANGAFLYVIIIMIRDGVIPADAAGYRKDLTADLKKLNVKRKWKIIVLIAVTATMLAAASVYMVTFSHADSSAKAALITDETVSVTRTRYGWFFDGPSGDDILVFYPGGKVESSAYAPLLHRLAEQGMDVCLVKMPFHLAVFGADKAYDVLGEYGHKNRYVGGHSLGGAIAANYAAEHADQLKGVILLAAYPTKPVSDRLIMVSIYGSEDGVLNMDRYNRSRRYRPIIYFEYVIEGGNHAQFGCYGKQKGDLDAQISSGEQQELTVDYIIQRVEKWR